MFSLVIMILANHEHLICLSYAKLACDENLFSTNGKIASCSVCISVAENLQTIIAVLHEEPVRFRLCIYSIEKIRSEYNIDAIS